MPQNNILLRDSYYRLTIKMRARAAVPFTLSRRSHLTFTNTKFSPIIVCCDTKIVLTSWLKGLVSWSSLLLCQRQRWHVWVSEATHIICLGLKQLKRNSCPFSLRLGESRRKKKHATEMLPSCAGNCYLSNSCITIYVSNPFYSYQLLAATLLRSRELLSCVFNIGRILEVTLLFFYMPKAKGLSEYDFDCKKTKSWLLVFLQMLIMLLRELE